MPGQGTLFDQPKGKAQTHAPLAESQGKCGTKVLLRSKSNPAQRRWQCTSGQREMFRDPHAMTLMSELGRAGGTHLTQRRAEHPSIRKLQDEGLINVKGNPKHYNYEYNVSLTSDGKAWLKMHTDKQTKRAQGKQAGMFKGLVIHERRLMRKCGCMKKADKLPGGKGDDTDPKDVDPKELAEGIEHEGEHTSDPGIAQEIAVDHLTEDGSYYSKLDGLEKCKGDTKCPCAMTKATRFVVRAGARSMRKAVTAPHPIIDADIVQLEPTSGVWTIGGYQFEYRQGRMRIGVLTVTAPSMPLPLHVVCGSFPLAQSKSHDLHKQIEAGVVPDAGVFRRLEMAAPKYGAPQGGQVIQ